LDGTFWVLNLQYDNRVSLGKTHRGQPCLLDLGEGAWLGSVLSLKAANVMEDCQMNGLTQAQLYKTQDTATLLYALSRCLKGKFVINRLKPQMATGRLK
jgi:hypothetical protein